MKKTFLFRITSILLVALVLSASISCYFLATNMLEDNVESMYQTLKVIDKSLQEESGLEMQLADLYEDAIEPPARVTVIGLDGSVLADSNLAEVSELENHLDREEVQMALAEGQGYAARYSESLDKYLLYAAIISANKDKILRMSVPYTNIFDYIYVFFPILLIGTVIAFIVSVFLAMGLSNSMASREVKARMEQMEKERKVRQEFFSNVSHELKTPMTSIRGYVELLNQDFAVDETMRKDFLNRILTETKHMSGLIDDILMISRLETKEAEVTLAKVNLKALLDEVEVSMLPMAKECGVTLHTQCQDVEMVASALQIRELFSNLISNGIKYNQPGGNVWARARREEDTIVMEVEDDGFGIEAEDQSRVFERFYRVDKGRSRKMGGTGLGLSIVKHIAEYYGGTVELVSEIGKGSTFIVKIPLIGINKQPKVDNSR